MSFYFKFQSKGLISALIEQNLMTPFDNELADYLEKIGPPQSMYLSPKSMAKKLTFNTNSSSNSTLERKIKKTLIEQGILDIDENDKTPDCLSENESSIVKKEANSANRKRNSAKKNENDCFFFEFIAKTF